MASEAPKDWIELYRSALMELDRGQLPEKIEAARQAIEARINQLPLQKDHVEEHRELEDALRNLRSLKRQIQ